MGKKTGSNPTDRAKRGTKRSVLTDARGVPLGLAVDGANRHDSKLVRDTLESIPIRRPRPKRYRRQNLCLDNAYNTPSVRELLEEFGFTAHIRGRREEALAISKQARFRARRWVVERTHSWLNRFRALLIRWSKRPDAYVAQLHLAFAVITWRTADLLG